MTTDETPFSDPVPLDPTGPGMDPETAAVYAELDKAQRQIADYKSLIADFDNSRKRLVLDAERQRKYAHEPLARDILSAMDNLHRALLEAKKVGDDGPLAKGVSMTVNLMLDLLKRHGVKRLEIPVGSPLDPNTQQAVMQQPSTDVPPGCVVQVLEEGFLLHDRVLRPASVIVAGE